jgi:hypothetical protein
MGRNQAEACAKTRFEETAMPITPWRIKGASTVEGMRRKTREPSASSVGDTPAGQIVRGQLDGDLVARKNANEELTHLSGNVGQYPVAIFELYPKHGVGQWLNDRPFHNNGFFFCQNAQNSMKCQPIRLASAV